MEPQYDARYEEPSPAGAPLSAAPGPFARQVADEPVADAADEQVLARLLARLLVVGERPTAGQRSFYEAFTSRVDTPAEALGARPVSQQDVGAVAAGVRETMYMLAVALGCARGEPGEAVEVELDAQRTALGIGPSRADELARHAREYLVEERLVALHASGGGEAERQAIEEFADALGVSALDVEAAERRVLAAEGDSGIPTEPVPPADRPREPSRSTRSA